MANKVTGFVKKLTPYNIQKGICYLKHFGLKEFLVRLSDRLEPEEVPYGPWFEAHRAGQEQLERQRRRKWERPVKISIAVPLYRTPEVFLREMIESVRAQTYPYWELCLADGSPEDEKLKQILSQYAKEDDRILVRILEKNRGIADNTNAALEMATGEYIGLLDHDDFLEPDALFRIASAIEDNAWPDLLYTDEDKSNEDGSEYFQPNFKPYYNPDLLRSNNYICHFLVAERDLIARAGGFDCGYDGAQDYDFILRCTEKAHKIAHVPRVLYHWRTHPKSTADNPISKQYAYDAGKRAIEAHLTRVGETGCTVERKKDFGFYRVKYPVQGQPFVSIIIPNKDEKETLQKCLESIRVKTTYENYEIIIVENNSKTEEIFAYYKEIDGRNGVHVVYWDREFNYSAINNFGVSKASGEYIVFLNNDVEIISENWLEELLGH